MDVKKGGAWLLDEILRQYPSQAEFARAAGVRTQYVSNWVNGKIDLSIDFLPAVARALHTDARIVAERMDIPLPGRAPQPRSAEEILAELEANQPVAVPIIQNLVAHMGNGGGIIADYWYLPPRYRKSKRKNILGVVAIGECMSPLIEPGDYVVFDTDAPWKKGDIVVAAVNGEMQVKRLIESEKRLVLRGDADGSTLVLGPEDQIFGRVIMFTRPLVPLEM